MKRVLCVLFLFAQFGAVQALTGNELLENCKDSNAGFKSGLCFGYVLGQSNGFSDGRQSGAIFQFLGGRNVESEDVQKSLSDLKAIGERAKFYCIPSGVTNQQRVDIVVQYLERNSAIRHNQASLLILAAHQDAFPCPM